MFGRTNWYMGTQTSLKAKHRVEVVYEYPNLPFPLDAELTFVVQYTYPWISNTLRVTYGNEDCEHTMLLIFCI